MKKKIKAYLQTKLSVLHTNDKHLIFDQKGFTEFFFFCLGRINPFSISSLFPWQQVV